MEDFEVGEKIHVLAGIQWLSRQIRHTRKFKGGYVE